MLRFAPQETPNQPGVYIFRNAAGEVIYVGKARSLRKRLSSYFQPSRQLQADPKLRALIHSIAAYEIIEVASEAEALLLESRLIKQYAPRYNVELRDDKRFLHVCVDPNEPYPRLTLVRLRKDDKRLYFGPFPRAGVLRQTVDFLSRRFGLRTCAVRDPGPESRRHCLDHVIRDCLCPCSSAVTPESYRQHLEAALDVLRGAGAGVTQELKERMAKAAAARRYEDAAQMRDMIENLDSICAPTRRFLRATIEERGRRQDDAVKALQEALGLPVPPLVIEGFDLSNIGGRLAVGSLVCFRAGRASTADYRHYRIRSEAATDDTAMMREVVTRRYARLQREGLPLPDLIVVDGGRGQLHAAMMALEQVGVAPRPLLGLAKRREEIFLPGRPDSLILPEHHPGLRLLQALRDEAHRFAISYHRVLRQRRLADSVLLEVEGVGRERCAQLLRALGSVRRLRRCSAEEIAAAVPGLGLVLARRIQAHLAGVHEAP